MEKKVYLNPSIKVLATGQMLLNETLSVMNGTVDGNDVLGKENLFGEEDISGLQLKLQSVWDD